jgi:hypothetical protein
LTLERNNDDYLFGAYLADLSLDNVGDCGEQRKSVLESDVDVYKCKRALPISSGSTTDWNYAVLQWSDARLTSAAIPDFFSRCIFHARALSQIVAKSTIKC